MPLLRTLVALGSLFLILVACTPAKPVPSEGRESNGNNQLVTFTRDRTGSDPSELGMQVVSGSRSISWSILGASGCGAVDYPWFLSVGPRPSNDEDISGIRDSDDGYEELLDSGDVEQGTTIVWVDVSPAGEVTAGWGKPAWAMEDVPANCG